MRLKLLQEVKWFVSKVIKPHEIVFSLFGTHASSRYGPYTNYIWSYNWKLFMTVNWYKYGNIIFKSVSKAFDDFKNKQKNVWSNAFWYVKVCIFLKNIQYTIHWDKTQILKKVLWTNKRYKKCPLFSFANSNLSQSYF